MERELQLLQDRNERLEKEYTDLINQIRLLEEENAKLKEENKKLKEESAEVDKSLSKLSQEVDGIGDALEKTQALFDKPETQIEIPPKK